MAGNPAAAFLAGVRSIDNLETNRQIRAFNEEKMSRTRLLWERQDEEYERVQLERKRDEYLTEFDASMQDVLNSIPEGEVGEWLDDGGIRAVNEVMKHMQAKDPTFGEHMALALGFDPGAGSLVNSQQPVANVGVAPGRGAFFTVWRGDGIEAPMTDNRTDAGGDPVSFSGMPTMQQLVKVFGKRVMSNDFNTAVMIRRMVGIEEPTGNPVDGGQPQKRQPATIEGEATEVAPTLSETTVLTDEERATLPLEEQYRLSEARRNAQVADAQYKSGATKFGEGVRDQAGQFADDITTPIVRKAEESVFTPGSDANVVADKYIVNSAKSLHGAFVKPVTDFFGGLFDVGGVETPVAKKPATTGSELVEAGSKPSTYAPTQVTSEVGAQKAVEEAAVPASNEVAKQTAGRVLQAENKRPTFVDIYNMAGLVRMSDDLDITNLMHYAKTGRLTATERSKLQVIQSDGYARFFNPDTGELSGAVQIAPGGGDAGSAELKDQQAFLNLLQDSLPFDNEQMEASYISGMTGAMEALGINLNSKAGLDTAATPRVRNAVSAGAGFINNFDADTAQNMFEGTGDWNPLPGSDPEFPVSAGSIALGTEAALQGIDNQGDADEFLLNWGGRYLKAFKSLSAEEMIANVRQYETFLKQQNPRDLNKARRELIETLIERAE